MAKQPENNQTASFGDKFIAFANKVSDVSGLVAAYLLVPLVIVFLIECISRNLFNSPTTWAYGMCFIIGGCAAVLGFGYAMKSGAMVRIDAFSSKLPEKAHCILDPVSYTHLDVYKRQLHALRKEVSRRSDRGRPREQDLAA